MLPRNARSLNRLGLTLIRLIIASYLMASSIELIDGIHPKAMFSHMHNQAAAEILGAFLLFMGSYLLMCGLAVRLVSIYLALLVISSSFMQHFMLVETAQLGSFWRDLVLVAALMLNYGTMTHRELQKAAFVREAYKVRRAVTKDGISPRRVTSKLENPSQLREDSSGGSSYTGAALDRPLPARERPISLRQPPEKISPDPVPKPDTPAPTPPSRTANWLEQLMAEDEDEVENIFAT